MKYKVLAIILISVMLLAVGDSICCDNNTHTATTPLNILKSIRWDMQGYTVTIGSDYPVSGIELKNGTLLATWSNEPMNDADVSNISGALSSDGKNWSDPFVLVYGNGSKVTEEQYVYNGNDLYEFYTDVNETRYQDGIEPSIVYIRKSIDGTVMHWSDPIEVSNWSRYFSITSQPIHLSTGRWIFPVEYMDPENTSHWYSSVFYSDDFDIAGLNATWKQGGIINDPNIALSEMTIVQSTHDQIWGLLRHDSEGMEFWETYSSDGGITWENPMQSNIQSANARPHLLNSDTGILLAWNDVSTAKQGGRNPLTIENINTGKKITLANNYHGNEYHNMGIIERDDGDTIVITATNDIPWSYYYFPLGIEYVTQYVSGIQSYIVSSNTI